MKEPFDVFKKITTKLHTGGKGGERQVIGSVCFTSYYGGLNIGGSFKDFYCLGFCVLFFFFL